MNTRLYRIGQIVPSSNTTMETEIPAMMRNREMIRPECFTFHSSRMRMKKVSKEELAAMDSESDRCALELSDARVDVLCYACLVAIMASGLGYHRKSEERLRALVRDNGLDSNVITSAGALVDAIHVLKAKKIALVAPYMKPLTKLVVDYLTHEEIEVSDYRALEIPDNLEVGRQDPERLPAIVAEMNTKNVDAIVISACVQMPSLPAVSTVEEMTGKPVLSASIATTYWMLRALNLEPIVPGAGTLLSGRYYAMSGTTP